MQNSAITRDDVERLAELSRLELTGEEKEALTKDLTSILSYVSELNSVDATIEGGREATHNTMREDSNPHEPGIHTDDLLSAAPKVENGYLSVKQILSK